MDELAARVKADPVEYRLRHLKQRARDRRAQGRGEGGELGGAPIAAGRASARRASPPAAAWLACLRRRQRIYRHGRRGRSESGHRKDRGEAHRRRIDAGPISNPDGLKNQVEGGALQGMSRALLRRGDVGRPEGDFGRLANVSHLAAGLRCSRSRMRAAQPARGRSDGRGRDLHHGGCGRHRQRDLRRDRRAPSPDSVHSGARESGAQRAGVKRAALTACGTRCRGLRVKGDLLHSPVIHVRNE